MVVYLLVNFLDLPLAFFGSPRKLEALNACSRVKFSGFPMDDNEKAPEDQEWVVHRYPL